MHVEQQFTISDNPFSLPLTIMPTSAKNKNDESFSLIPREKLLALYAGLLRCQMLENFIAENIQARRSSTRTSSAAAVAACLGHRPGDAIAAPARDLLPTFVIGKSLTQVLSSLHTPVAAQRSRFAAQLRAALAAARNIHSHGDHRIVIVFGRPATGRQWQTMLHTATTERLPILFVCKGQSHRRTLRPARYLPAIAVDRDDAVALYRVASEGMAHARRGNGPTLIECIPWPSLTKKTADPIAKMEAFLKQKGVSPSRRKTIVTAKFESELARLKRNLSK
jgi:hypothetical protein